MNTATNTAKRMPALFIGHGSPMNAIEDNFYTSTWKQLGVTLPRPKALLVISAHWCTSGVAAVTAMQQPRTIHDFYGFPQKLYEQQYAAPGSPALAKRVQELLAPLTVVADTQKWGLDHGAWSVLVHLYPEANIPVVQLSIDLSQGAAYHYELGRKLAPLRDEGVLLLGSGNVVHNIGMCRNGREAYDWASAFDQFVGENLRAKPGARHPLVNYKEHEAAKMSAPTAEHFVPLLYVLGSWDGDEMIVMPLEGIESGSISMLSVQVG